MVPLCHYGLEKWLQIWYHCIGGTMANINKIYSKACASVNNITFSELCSLIEDVGFEFDRQKGTSHKIYKHPMIQDRLDSMVNAQDDHGKAKPYQVKIVLDLIEKYGLL